MYSIFFRSFRLLNSMCKINSPAPTESKPIRNLPARPSLGKRGAGGEFTFKIKYQEFIR